MRWRRPGKNRAATTHPGGTPLPVTVTIVCLHLLMFCAQRWGTHRVVSAMTEDGGVIGRRKAIVVVFAVAALRFAGAFHPAGARSVDSGSMGHSE